MAPFRFTVFERFYVPVDKRYRLADDEPSLDLLL